MAYLYCTPCWHIFIAYPYCISLWHIFLAYAYCRFLSLIFLEYLYCISSLHILMAYLYCISLLRIFMAYLPQDPRKRPKTTPKMTGQDSTQQHKTAKTTQHPKQKATKDLQDDRSETTRSRRVDEGGDEAQLTVYRPLEV